MQAEPWGPDAVTNLSDADMAKTMTPEKLQYILNFGHRQASKNFYLWGVEWWAWEKQVKGNDYYGITRRTLFQ